MWLYVLLAVLIALSFYMIAPRSPTGGVDDVVELGKYLVFWPTVAIVATILLAAGAHDVFHRHM